MRRAGTHVLCKARVPAGGGFGYLKQPASGWMTAGLLSHSVVIASGCDPAWPASQPASSFHEARSESITGYAIAIWQTQTLSLCVPPFALLSLAARQPASQAASAAAAQTYALVTIFDSRFYDQFVQRCSSLCLVSVVERGKPPRMMAAQHYRFNL